MSLVPPGLTVGLKIGVPFQDYLKIDALNCSTLKKVNQSPKHALAAKTAPSVRTPALVFGDAVHAKILEPDRFEDEYVQGLDIPKKSKADKEAWKEFNLENEGKTVLKAEEMEHLHRMEEAIFQHPIADALMRGEDGHNEVTMLWEDPDTDAPCKGRTDRITKFEGEGVIIDLKSTRDSSPEAWGKDAARFFYHSQAAWYLAGAEAIAPYGASYSLENGKKRRFLFVCVEKTPPYGVTVQELNDEAIDAGARLNRIWLRRWLACKNSGNWTSYPNHIINQQLPQWALNHANSQKGS